MEVNRSIAFLKMKIKRSIPGRKRAVQKFSIFVYIIYITGGTTE